MKFKTKGEYTAMAREDPPQSNPSPSPLLSVSVRRGGVDSGGEVPPETPNHETDTSSHNSHVPESPPLDSTVPSKGKGRPPGPGITPGKAIKRSGKARASRLRDVAFDAHPAEFLIAVMQGEVIDGEEGPASLRDRIDVAKFLTNKLVGNAAPQPVEDSAAMGAGQWVLDEAKRLEEQGRLEGE